MPEPPAENPEWTAPERTVDHMLVFSIEEREFGVPIGPVIEIVPHRGATRVPLAGPGVEGILFLRGRMVTVLDVRRGLSLPPRRPGSKAQVVVIESSGDLLGLVVDAVGRVAGAGEGVARFDLGALLAGLT